MSALYQNINSPFLFLPVKLTWKSKMLFFIRFDEAESPCLLVIILRSSMILQFVPSWNLAVLYLPVISQSQPLEEFWVSASSHGTDAFNKGRWPPSRSILALQQSRNINLFLLTRRKKTTGRHHVGVCCVSLFVLHILEITPMRKVYASSWSFVRISAMCLIP